MSKNLYPVGKEAFPVAPYEGFPSIQSGKNKGLFIPEINGKTNLLQSQFFDNVPERSHLILMQGEFPEGNIQYFSLPVG